MSDEFTPGEMLARVAKLLGIGLNPESGTPRMPASASEAGGRYPDTPETPGAILASMSEAVCPNCGQWQDHKTGDCFNECAARGFAKYDPWAERREAFSNEGEDRNDE